MDTNVLKYCTTERYIKLGTFCRPVPGLIQNHCSSQGYTIDYPSNGNIIFGVCKNITCGDDKTSTACWIDKNKKATSIGRSAKSTLEHSGDVTTLTYP
jgi:hypothetical protein